MALEIGKDRVVFAGPYINVVEREFRNTITGHRGVWHVVERSSKLPIAVMAAITPERELILIKTFRVPMKCWNIEACAGLIDPQDKDVEAGARRELLEETGYTVGKVEKLMQGPHNAGMQADQLHIFLGWDAQKVQEPQLEDGECIEVIKVPVDGLMEFLKSQPKDIQVDVKLYSLIPFLEDEGRE